LRRGVNVGDVGALDNEFHLELLGNRTRRAFLRERAHLQYRERGLYKGSSLMRNTHPPRITIGPWA
jgi:hypothetical protein